MAWWSASGADSQRTTQQPLKSLTASRAEVAAASVCLASPSRTRPVSVNSILLAPADDRAGVCNPGSLVCGSSKRQQPHRPLLPAITDINALTRLDDLY